VICIEKNW